MRISKTFDLGWGFPHHIVKKQANIVFTIGGLSKLDILLIFTKLL